MNIPCALRQSVLVHRKKKNPQHQQVEDGSSWGFRQDNRTVKNSILLIAASHTHVLFVSALTDVSLAPVAASKRFIQHPWVDVRVTATSHGSPGILPCQTVCVSVLIHSKYIYTMGGHLMDHLFCRQ